MQFTDLTGNGFRPYTKGMLGPVDPGVDALLMKQMVTQKATSQPPLLHAIVQGI
jgi:hypothetical protein